MGVKSFPDGPSPMRVASQAIRKQCLMFEAPPPPPPLPPPLPPPASATPSAAFEAYAYASLEQLLEAAGASTHALAFEEQQYTLADVYSALRAGELMTDLAQLIPILGVRRRIVTCLTRQPEP